MQDVTWTPLLVFMFVFNILQCIFVLPLVRLTLSAYLWVSGLLVPVLSVSQSVHLFWCVFFKFNVVQWHL